MISAKNLSKNFGPLRAVRNLSFDVHPGEILGFLGPNGAGKSTTLRMLSGLIPPTSGTGTIGGSDLLLDSLGVRSRMGYLPERTSLPPELRVHEFLSYRAGLKNLPSGLARKRIQDVSIQLGIQKESGRKVGTLSKGFAQRVALADALLADPPCLLLDEPFGGLDPLQRLEFRALLKDLAANGKAILFSSHVLPEVEGIADKIVVIHEGRLLAYGTLLEFQDEIAGDPVIEILPQGDATLLIRRFMDSPPHGCSLVESDSEGLRVSTLDQDARAGLLAWLAEEEIPLRSLTQVELSLEDVFGRLVGKASAEGEES